MRDPSTPQRSVRKLLESYGFAMLTTLCVTIITVTALWAKKAPAPISTTPPVINLPASVSMQQTLSDVTPMPEPTLPTAVWQAPLPEIRVIRSCSYEVMCETGIKGLWAVHDGVDLAADAGTPVLAIASGYVADCGTDDVNGAWISLAHDNGYRSLYRSLGLLGSFKKGDPVRAGQVIGFIGNEAVYDENIGPHLHLEVHQQKDLIDPLTLFP